MQNRCGRGCNVVARSLQRSEAIVISWGSVVLGEGIGSIAAHGEGVDVVRFCMRVCVFCSVSLRVLLVCIIVGGGLIYHCVWCTLTFSHVVVVISHNRELSAGTH